jgi:MoxR-like ATPase
MFKVHVGYPSSAGGARDHGAHGKKPASSLRSKLSSRTEQIMEARNRVDDVYVDDRIKDYILSIVHATRKPQDFGIDYDAFIEYGASPRATIALAMGARAHAFLRGKAYVTPFDVKAIGADVLRHRIMLTYEAEAEEITPEDVIEKVFDQVPIP